METHLSNRKANGTSILLISHLLLCDWGNNCMKSRKDLEYKVLPG